MTPRAVRRVMVLGLIAIAILGTAAQATVEDPLVVYFYEVGCPDCAQIKSLLEGMVYDLPRGEEDIASYDIAEDGTLDLLAKLESAYGVEIYTTPVVFVSERVFTADDELQIMDAISRCKQGGCVSPLEIIAPEPFPWGDLFRFAAVAVIGALLAFWQTR